VCVCVRTYVDTAKERGFRDLITDWYSKYVPYNSELSFYMPELEFEAPRISR
jgi:hypothetical protein